MPNVTKATDPALIEATLLEWMAVHGNLCLALRHPKNSGDSRALIVAMVHRIGKVLVAGGLLTQEELSRANRLEQDQHGMESFQ